MIQQKCQRSFLSNQVIIKNSSMMTITTSNNFHLKNLEITNQVTAPAFAETEKRS